MKTGVIVAIMTCLLPVLPAAAQDMPKEYQQVLAMVGRTGDYQDHVLKINVPRNDVHVTVAGMPLPTAFGFGGWIGMTKASDGAEVAMGDLVLLQDEVNPVMSALLDAGFDVTALHNHFFWDEPRMFYMHVHGRGAAADLARRLKPALDLIGTGSPRPGAAGPASAPAALAIDTARIAQVVGRTGATGGGVYKIVVGRDDLKVAEMGAVINTRMGLSSWAAFAGTDARASVAGDIAMVASEVTPVLKALRAHGLDVVAIHQHMTGTTPTIMFLHYWGTGRAADLAAGFRAALDELGRTKRG